MRAYKAGDLNQAIGTALGGLVGLCIPACSQDSYVNKREFPILLRRGQLLTGLCSFGLVCLTSCS